MKIQYTVWEGCKTNNVNFFLHTSLMRPVTTKLKRYPARAIKKTQKKTQTSQLMPGSPLNEPWGPGPRPPATGQWSAGSQGEAGGLRATFRA